MGLIIQTLFMSLAFAVAWVGITGRVSLESFAVGFVLSFLTLRLLHRMGVRYDIRMKTGHPLAALKFMWTTVSDGLNSSIQMTRLILSPKIELNTAILALKTGDTSKAQQFTAFSAHSLNLSPGTLVIDFEEDGTLYVHCLDAEAARKRLEADQVRRMSLLKQMMGDSEHE